MKKAYNVTFQWGSSNTYCSNIALAERLTDIDLHYTAYGKEIISITQASESDIHEAKVKGKPIVDCSNESPIDNHPQLRTLLEAFDQAFSRAYDLRMDVLERLEEITGKSRYDFDEFIESSDNWVFGFNEANIEELLEGEQNDD